MRSVKLSRLATAARDLLGSFRSRGGFRCVLTLACGANDLFLRLFVNVSTLHRYYLCYVLAQDRIPVQAKSFKVFIPIE